MKRKEQLDQLNAMSVDELNEATVVLTVMIERLGGTLRRYSLLGHAHKRLSMRLAEQGLDAKAESLAHLLSAARSSNHRAPHGTYKAYWVVIPGIQPNDNWPLPGHG